jgi:hypothetical protein
MFIGGKASTYVSTALAENCSKLEKSDILLDSCSSINIFHNGDLLDNINKFHPPKIINGIGGDIRAHACGELLGMKVYVSPDSPANILSLARVEDNYSISHNSANGSFDVTIPSWKYPWRFMRRDDVGGLRVSVASTDMTFVTTVSGNKIDYTKRELSQAEMSREISKRLSYPSDKQLAMLINRGAIINIPITSSDVHRATKIFGPDVASQIGKTTNSKPTPLPVEPIFKKELVHIRRNTKLHIDIFFVNQHIFLLSVSDFDYIMCVHLNDRRTITIAKHITDMIKAYKGQGFVTNSICADLETGFVALKPSLEEIGVTLIQHAPDHKVSKAERKIRVIKERNRALRADLPYKLYGTLLIWSILNVARCLNLHLSSTNTEMISPREKFTGVRTDYRRDLPIAFGEYCIVYNTNNKQINSSNSRVLHVISLMPTGGINGEIKFLHLESGKVITRTKFKHMPMPNEVINFINNNCPKNLPESMAFRNTRSEIGDVEPDDEDILQVDEIDTVEEVIDSDERQTIPTIYHRGGDDELLDQINNDEVLDQINVTDSEAEITSNNNMNDDNNIQNNNGNYIDGDNNNGTSNNNDTVIETSDDIINTPTTEDEEISNSTRRYPMRSNRTTWRDRTFHVSVKQALKTYKDEALVSIIKEIRSIAIIKKAFIPVHQSNFSNIKVIPSSLFLKAKFKPDGSFEKLKSRLVAGGHMQNREEYSTEDITSPTVSITSVLTNIAIATIENRKCKCVDIGTAYLNTSIPRNKTILMRLNNLEAELLCTLEPSYSPYKRRDGTIVVQLMKALYGCIESARLWYEDLTRFFKSLGFVPNTIDNCVLNKYYEADNTQLTLMIHVDDIIFTCKNITYIDEVINQLQLKFVDINVQDGPILNYLGMVFNFDNEHEFIITMPG